MAVTSPYVELLHVFILVLQLPDLAQQRAEHTLHLDSDLRVRIGDGELLVQLVDLLLAAEQGSEVVTSGQALSEVTSVPESISHIT